MYFKNVIIELILSVNNSYIAECILYLLLPKINEVISGNANNVTQAVALKCLQCRLS